MKKNLNKILIVFDSFEFSPLSLQTVIDLAVALQYEIHALYIEDINLLNAVALPFSREVSLLTASVRELKSTQLLNGLKADAENIKKQFEQIALTRSISINFQSTQGHKVQVIKNRQHDVNMVLIPAVSSTRGSKIHQRTWQLIVLLYQQNSALCHRALSLSLIQAVKTHCALFILLDSQQNISEVQMEADRMGVEASFQVVDFSKVDEVLVVLKNQIPQLLVLAEDNMLIDDEKAFKKMLNTVNSDILILRS